MGREKIVKIRESDLRIVYVYRIVVIVKLMGKVVRSVGCVGRSSSCATACRPLASTIYSLHAKHFHAALDTFAQSACDALDPPEDNVFERSADLAVIPVANGSGNRHCILAEYVCGCPGLTEDAFGDVMVSFVLVCAAAY